MARAIAIDVAPVAFCAATAIHRLIHRLPLTPGSWGVSELAAIGLFGLVGIGPDDAFALALLLRALQLFVASPGLWFLLREGKSA